MKGTLLYQLKSDYELLESYIKQTMVKYSYHRNHILPELKATRDGLKQKYQHCKQHGELEDRIKLIKDQLLWAQIEVHEAEVEDNLKRIAEVKARAEMYEGKLAETMENVRKSAEEIERIAQEVAVSDIAIEPLKVRQIEHKDDQKSYLSQLRQLEIEKNEMNDAIGTNRKQIEAYNTQIEAVYERGENSEYD